MDPILTVSWAGAGNVNPKVKIPAAMNPMNKPFFISATSFLFGPPCLNADSIPQSGFESNILARVYRLFEAQVEWQGSVAVGVLWISC
jgi:hypothetical protein